MDWKMHSLNIDIKGFRGNEASRKLVLFRVANWYYLKSEKLEMVDIKGFIWNRLFWKTESQIGIIPSRKLVFVENFSTIVENLWVEKGASPW
jgi:hypothetical protein